jgi:hypothetical protein
MALTEQDLEDCQNLIDELPAGVYELKEIYREFYGAIVAPKQFGKDFKRAVVQQKLKRIETSHIDAGDKHWRYRIFDRS